MKTLRQILLVLLFSAGMSFTLSAQQEVTNGVVRQYSINLTNVTAPSGVKTINWVVERKDGNPLEAGITSSFPDSGDKNQSIAVTWNGTVGDIYVLKATLEDNNSCLSEAVSQEIEILPADGNFTFADGAAIAACSFNGVAETKSFSVNYAGIKPWKLHYRLTDKGGVSKDFVASDAGGEIEFATADVSFDVNLDNFFINNELTDKDWTIELIKAVSVADSHETMPNGAATSITIQVHTLPVIGGGISLN